MHYFKLNDMHILRKKTLKNKKKFKLIVGIDFSPLGEAGFETEFEFSYQNRI